MSRVSECLKQILSARYGKDVRQSIHDGIKELDEVARTAQGSATLSAQTAIAKANEALTASQEAIESAKQAKAYSDNAQAVAGVTVATQDNAGLVKGGENHIALDGTLELVVKTTEASMPNSRKGRVEVVEIGGVSKQDNIPSPELIQEVKKSVVTGIKTHGKNHIGIRNFDSDIREVKGITYTIVRNSDGSLKYINVNGTSTETSTLAVSLQEDIHLIVGESYILSGCPSGGSADKYRLQFYNIDGNKSFAREYGKGTEFVFSNETNDYNIAININSGVTVDNLKFYPMIRKADIADATYEPYKESSITFSQPIDLYGIGDVQDVIEDGKVKRRFTEVVFDGSNDEWWYSENNYFRFQGITTDNTAPILCTHLQQTKIYDEINSKSGTIYVIINGFSINMTGICSTVAELRTWLADNQLTVIYGLPTETTEDLPLADQIALNSLATFDGATYMEFDSEVQPTFKGNYGTSLVGSAALEGLLIARNNELRISALEA